jgi:LuxR family maltose regulon positive regulatory protein
VRRAQGDTAGAVALAREIEALCRRSSFVTMDEFSVTPIFLPLWMAQGQMEVVERWAEAAVRFLAGEWGQGLYPYVGGLSARMMLARVRLVQERAGEALALLDPLLPDVERLGQRTVEIEILLLQARAHAALDHAAAAQAALERALLLAEPEGYVRIFLDEGEPVRALLRLVAARRAAPAYVQRLLAAFEGTEAQSPRAGRAAALVEPLSDRELEVLRLLADGMSNRAIAHRLIVAVGTVKRHINNIYGKLDVHSRTQAVARARELELI